MSGEAGRQGGLVEGGWRRAGSERKGEAGRVGGGRMDWARLTCLGLLELGFIAPCSPSCPRSHTRG